MKVTFNKSRTFARRRALVIAGAAVLLALIVAAAVLIVKANEYDYTPLTQEQINAIVSDETDPIRLGVVDSALSLVGKVHYFWGGKSEAVGFDERWGELMEVKSGGSETTGTLRPYGLDCSGFVSWCVIQQGYTFDEMCELVGNGTYNQWEKSAEIKMRDIRPGDIAFQNKYPNNIGNHIGICVGFNESGKPLFAHCASGFDNVVVTDAGDVFRYARRPVIYGEN